VGDNLNWLRQHFPVAALDGWDGALQLLAGFCQYDENDDRFHSRYLWRGLNSTEHTLEHMLQRAYRAAQLAPIERGLLRDFKRLAHGLVPAPRMPAWEWLALARHHGLPTRMLDWSTSPLVALYFSTDAEDALGRDGLVWRIDTALLRRSLPQPYRRRLERRGAGELSAADLALRLDDNGRRAADGRHCASLAGLRRLDQRFGTFCLWFAPPTLDERIATQYASFTLLSDPAARMDAWLLEQYAAARQHDNGLADAVRLYVVRGGRGKREIVDYLAALNVTPRLVFPGLDGVARTLARQYGPGREASAAYQSQSSSS
jgi:hypothetical protein